MSLTNEPANTAEDDRASALIGIVESYFRLSDAGSPETLDLFSEDVQIYFPIFGIRSGKAAFGSFVEGFLAKIGSLAHNVGDFRWTVSGNTVVVEGTTRGTDLRGTTWSGGETPGGRFCSVFDISQGLITRMYIYTDPDYTGQCSHGFGWDRVPEGGW